MILFILITAINLCTWVPTIIKSDNKGRTAAMAAVTYALSLASGAAVRYLLTT